MELGVALLYRFLCGRPGHVRIRGFETRSRGDPGQNVDLSGPPSTHLIPTEQTVLQEI